MYVFKYICGIIPPPSTTTVGISITVAEWNGCGTPVMKMNEHLHVAHLQQGVYRRWAPLYNCLHSTLYINTPARFLPGQTYRVGMVLPQEVGNCLQCVCVEAPAARPADNGVGEDDDEDEVEQEPPSARVTCSPHNCPPLILPDLFDTTGY